MKRVFTYGQNLNGITYLRELPPYVTGPTDKTPKKGYKQRGLVRCICGKEFEIVMASIISGRTKSCGCHKIKTAEENTIHGLARTKGQNMHYVYRNWQNIKTRCYNPKRHDYKDYGGRGITLSPEFHDVVTFFNYVTGLDRYDQRAKLNLTLDRIDDDKNYERGNLRWATKKEQRLNQRTYEPSTFLRVISLYYDKFNPANK